MSYFFGHGSFYFTESAEGDAKAAEWGLKRSEPPAWAGPARYTEVGPGILRVEEGPTREALAASARRK